MKGIKKITLVGIVGDDPEVVNNPDGSSFAKFSLAIDVGTKSKPRTDWVLVNCNKFHFEIATKYITKGARLYIEGFPSAKAYITRAGEVGVQEQVYPEIIRIISSKNNVEPTEVGGDEYNNGEEPAY
ncbi:MAG: hypothetical protein EKK54_06250 [Neisseriaceae bacterium]|nr:MAG: hypothetical protein EKK54_06250 [Neisseriaceae bacterium]